jgi:hypothetical protein
LSSTFQQFSFKGEVNSSDLWPGATEYLQFSVYVWQWKFAFPFFLICFVYSFESFKYSRAFMNLIFRNVLREKGKEFYTSSPAIYHVDGEIPQQFPRHVYAFLSREATIVNENLRRVSISCCNKVLWLSTSSRWCNVGTISTTSDAKFSLLLFVFFVQRSKFSTRVKSERLK